MRVRWTEQALENLDNAVEYIAVDSPDNALGVAQKIWDGVQLLSGQPGIGRPGRVAGTRELVVPGLPFVIPYVEYNGELIILRIMHSSMKWPQAF